MPPNMPAGWQIPQWLQIVTVVWFILTPITVLVLTFMLKDRRQLKTAEDTALQSGQATFIDKILKAAEMAPELLAKNEDLMNVNAELRGIIHALKEEVEKLKAKVEALERDRDSWRDMALKVPALEAQLSTFDKMLREKEVNLEHARTERDNALRELTKLREEIGAGRVLGGRRTSDAPELLVQVGRQEEP